jgi:transposase
MRRLYPGLGHACTPRHDSNAVDRVLAGYQGYLVADAHVVYVHL